MTDKIALLRQICETPGWQPPEQASSIERGLQELVGEGWIAPRLDGWEATAAALETYPHFMLVGSAVVAAPRPASDGSAPADTVPVDRVTLMVRALLEMMPIMSVARLLQVTSADLPEDDLAWRIARDLTSALRRSDSPATPSASPTS